MRNREKYMFGSLAIISIFFINGCARELKGDLIVKNIAVINVKDGSVTDSMDIVIFKNRITEIVCNRKNTTYLTDEIIDSSGKYILPGLWDMHTHTWWAYEEFFPLLIVNGITGIREMWGDIEAIKKIRNKMIIFSEDGLQKNQIPLTPQKIQKDFETFQN